ncbi:MAG: sugar ABC transporter ATP-binding protein [Lachnospiraceae bacterium]
MSTFHDMVTRDMEVFFNPDEFGEEHIIDGKPVICVVDDQTYHDRKGGTEFAVAQSTVFLFARSRELPPRREPGEELRLDGVPYTIETWDEDMGVSSVSLFININA